MRFAPAMAAVDTDWRGRLHRITRSAELNLDPAYRHAAAGRRAEY
eukprot:gene13009-7021_t